MATFPFNTTNNWGPQSITLRDAKGNTATTRFYMNVGTAPDLGHAALDVEAVFDAFAAMSNAAIQSEHGWFTEYGVAQYGAHASGGSYESVIEKAVLVFQDLSGQLHRYQVPAPKVAIFKADKITVDPTNSLVAAFIGFMTLPGANGAFVITRQNIALANYMGGVFQGRRLRRRLSLLVLEPDLSSGLPAE